MALFVTAAGGIVFLPVLVAGWYGADYVSEKRRDAVRKKLELAANDHTQNMKGQIELISVMTDVLLENNVEAISKSPLHDRVMEIHGLTDKFADAAGKHIAKQNAPEATEAAPPAEAAVPPKKTRISKPGKQL